MRHEDDRDDGFYLRHILERISRIEEYTTDGESDFLSSSLTQDAVLLNLHILAESSQRLTAALEDRHPEIERRAMSAFRNILVHDYLGVNPGQVWEMPERELPVFKSGISEILDQLETPT